MKKLICFTTAAAMAAVMMAGCGKKSMETTAAPETTAAETEVEETTAAAAEEKVGLQDVMDANKLTDIVEKYGAVTLTADSYSGDETLSGSTYYFYKNDAGELQMLGKIHQASGNADYFTSAVSTDNAPTAIYMGDGTSTPAMLLSDSASLDKEISMYYLPQNETESDVQNSLQDDALVVSFKESYDGDGDNTGEYFYYVNPDTLELYALNYTYQYTTENEDGTKETVSGYTLYSVSYGENAEAAAMKSAADLVLTDENPCQLTMVFNPGTDKEEKQYFSIQKNTSVDIGYMTGYEKYADENCTEELLTLDTSADELTVYAKEFSQN